MMTFNVRASTVELITADSPEEAESILRAKLRAAGFEPFEADEFITFESEGA